MCIIVNWEDFNLDNYSKLYDETRKQIFKLLEERGLSQKEFADKLEISSQTITDWKKGKSNSFMQKLERISQALHTTPGWLVNGSGMKDFSDAQRDEWIHQNIQRNELWEKQFQEEMREMYFSTLEKIFERVGITQSDFYEISQGRAPSPEKMHFICGAFDITPEQLFEIAKGEEKGSAPVSKSEPLCPPEYDLLGPEDKALIDNMIHRLIQEKNQEGGSS